MIGEGTRAPIALYRRYVVAAVAATAAMLVTIPVTVVLGDLSVSWPIVIAAECTAAVVMVVAALLPWRSLAERPAGQWVLYAWSLFDVGAIGAVVAASGGGGSWFWTLFVLTTIFFAVGYPLRGQVALLAGTLVAFVSASEVASGLSRAALVWKVATLVAVFGLASYPASEMRRQAKEQRRAREDADRLATVLAEREAWWRSLIERTSDPIVVFDDHWHIGFASPAFDALLGYDPVGVRSMNMGAVIHEEDVERVRQAAAAIDAGSTPTRMVCRLRRADGSWRVVELSFAEIQAPGEGRVVANLHDVTERVAAEAALSHQATHDALTGLGNRTAFYDALRMSLEVSRRQSSPVSVLILDLESFKAVNDTVGHSVGDELLVEIAHRLATTLRAADVVARLGGDEFAAVLTTGGDPLGGTIAARRVQRALDEPAILGGRPFWLKASIGVASCPEHGEEAELLVQHADRAMYEAKRTGAGVCLYDSAMEATGTSQIGLLGELRKAIPDGELRLRFQPKVSLRHDEVIGVEALVRWTHPQLGLLSPAAFLPVAEASGLVRALTAWVLPNALVQLREWLDGGWDLSVSVNVSAQDLADDGFAGQVVRWLQEAGVPPGRLIIELTEASAISDQERGTGTLARLRSEGVRISLDDFGSGYSSLAYLAQLPLDEIKLDSGFLSASLESDAFLLRSVVEIGHHLGLTVVAEGVESSAAIQRLAEAGCDAMQGYVCAEALEADELVGFLAAWSAPAYEARTGMAAERAGQL